MAHSPLGKSSTEIYENDTIFKLRRSNSLKNKVKDIDSLMHSTFSDPILNLTLVKLILTLPTKERTPQMIEKVIDYTKNLKFFQSLRDGHSEDLHSTVCSYLLYEFHPKGSIVFKQGDKGYKFYVILEGTVRIYKETDGEIQELAQYSVGEKFGERALKYGVTRAASIECLTDCGFCSLDKTQFKKIFDSFFDKNFNMLSQMLKALPIYRGQSNTFIQKLGYLFKTKRFTKGNIIYKEGDSVTDVYFIQEGEFRLTRKAKIKNHKEKIKIKERKSFKSIQLASINKYELFGDEEIYTNSDIRLNSCHCYSNEGILFIVSKDVFLKNVIKNDEGFNLMKNRSLKKEQFRKILYENGLKLYDKKLKSVEFLPKINEKAPVLQNLIPTFRKPSILLQETINKSVSPAPALIPDLKLLKSYDNVKKYIGRSKKKYKPINTTPVNMHTAMMKYSNINKERKFSVFQTVRPGSSLKKNFTEESSIRSPKSSLKLLNIVL